MNAPSPLSPVPIRARARAFGRIGVAMGRNGLALIVAGLLWLIPAFLDSRFVFALFAWNTAVLVLWFVDLWGLPRPDRLSVTRRWPAAPALSVTSRVEVTIENDSSSALLVDVIDAVPHQLRPSPFQERLFVRPKSEHVTSYAITPAARGETHVGRFHLRYQSRLRVAERWAVADIAQTVVTCPNLAEAQRHSVFLIRSRQIDQERRSARIRGAGRAFESLREYRTGDEARDICWTASARRGKPVTRLYEVERSQTIWIVLDAGRLMRARVAGLSKLDYAVNAALSLAQVALNSGDEIGVLAYGRKIALRLPAARGSSHLRHVVTGLSLVREDEWEADHLLAAGRVLGDQSRRSLVVWITDLSETVMTPDVVRAATALMTRHVVLFVVIGEPDLQAMAARTPAAEMYETAAAGEVVERRERLLARLREGGALALETTAASLSVAVVNGYLDVKQRNRL